MIDVQPWSGLEALPRGRAVWVARDGERPVVYADASPDARNATWTLGAVAPTGCRAWAMAPAALDAVLLAAVHAWCAPALYDGQPAWRSATRYARVLIDWTPALGPDGRPLPDTEVPRMVVRDPGRYGLEAVELPPCVAPDWCVPRTAVWAEPRDGHARWLAGG